MCTESNTGLIAANLYCVYLWANIIGVGVALVALCFIYRSASAAKEAADATKQALFLTHRPRVIVRNIVIPELAKLNRQTPMNQWTQMLSGYYTLANTGGLPATINRAIEGVWIQGGLPMERPDRDNAGRTLSIRLNPGASKEICLTNIILPEDDAIGLINGVTNAYLLVQVDYVDDNNTIRHTSACRKFDPTAKRFVKLADSDYEYAD